MWSSLFQQWVLTSWHLKVQDQTPKGAGPTWFHLTRLDASQGAEKTKDHVNYVNHVRERHISKQQSADQNEGRIGGDIPAYDSSNWLGKKGKEPISLDFA